MPKAIRLTDIETAILLKASARRNGSVMPFPEGIDTSSAKTKKLIGRLFTAGLIEERSTKSAACAWRIDETGQNYTLRISASGRDALNDAAVPNGESTVPHHEPETVDAAPPEPRGKLGAVLAAVRAADGAALDQLVVLTGWQPHTVRASLTRLRQSGFPIQMMTTANGRRYMSEGAARQSSK